jgi:hypothetical protein
MKKKTPAQPSAVAAASADKKAEGGLDTVIIELSSIVKSQKEAPTSAGSPADLLRSGQQPKVVPSAMTLETAQVTLKWPLFVLMIVKLFAKSIVAIVMDGLTADGLIEGHIQFRVLGITFKVKLFLEVDYTGAARLSRVDSSAIDADIEQGNKKLASIRQMASKSLTSWLKDKRFVQASRDLDQALTRQTEKTIALAFSTQRS